MFFLLRQPPRYNFLTFHVIVDGIEEKIKFTYLKFLYIIGNGMEEHEKLPPSRIRRLERICTANKAGCRWCMHGASSTQRLW